MLNEAANPRSAEPLLHALPTRTRGHELVYDSDSTASPGPALVAHRGCAAEYPENTIRAVKRAASVADAIEVDVRRCGTGELVAFHDARLDRVTTSRGRLDQTPLDGVLDLEVADSSETIPTLDAVFEAVPAHVDLVLDLKESGLADDVLALHTESDHALLVSSFHPAIIEEVRQADPTVPTAYIVEDAIPNRLLRPLVPGAPHWLYLPEDVTGMVEHALALDCDAIHPRYELCLQTDLVERAHDAGLHVRPWTITTRREFVALTEAGVDAVISDVCTEFERWTIRKP